MFSAKNLQINRGTTTANAQGKFTLVKHSYKDKTQTVANIAALFPPFFGQGEEQEYILVGDLIDLSGSDKITVNEILSLNPVSLGPDLYLATSTSISADAPIAAVDNNAVKITGDVIQMEIADGSRPGIVSNLPQTFGGAKSFNGGVLSDSLDAINVGTLTIGQTNANLISLRQNTTVFAPRILRTNNLDATSVGPLTLLNTFATSFNVTPVLNANAGINLPTGGGTPSLLDFYETFSFSTTFSNNGDTTNSTDVVITRNGNLVTMRFSNEVTGTSASSPAPNYTSDVQIPSRFMPVGVNPLNGWWKIYDNSTYKNGEIQFDGSGSIYIFAGPDQPTWTASSEIRISACAFSWVI